VWAAQRRRLAYFGQTSTAQGSRSSTHRAIASHHPARPKLNDKRRFVPLAAGSSWAARHAWASISDIETEIGAAFPTARGWDTTPYIGEPLFIVQHPNTDNAILLSTDSAFIFVLFAMVSNQDLFYCTLFVQSAPGSRPNRSLFHPIAASYSSLRLKS